MTFRHLNDFYTCCVIRSHPRGMQSRMRGRSDGQLTPNRSFARSMETLSEPSTNGDAFEKLRQQVEDLRQQLKESNDLNKTLAVGYCHFLSVITCLYMELTVALYSMA